MPTPQQNHPILLALGRSRDAIRGTWQRWSLGIPVWWSWGKAGVEETSNPGFFGWILFVPTENDLKIGFFVFFGKCTHPENWHDKWKTNHLKMYVLLKHGDFPASHVTFRGGLFFKVGILSLMFKGDWRHAHVRCWPQPSGMEIFADFFGVEDQFINFFWGFFEASLKMMWV